MRVDGHEERSGLSRRSALRLLAASTGATAAGSMIVSQPAYADSGSESCRFEFTGTPTVAVTTVNQSGNRRDQCSISVSGVNGNCPCGGTATFEYAYFVVIPGLGTGGIGWISSPAVSVSNNPIWPNRGGSVTVRVGVRVTCFANGRAAIRCRFGEQTFEVGRNSSLTRTFTLPTNNGNSTPPAGIPACDPAALRAAPRLASPADEGSLWLIPGFQAPIPLDDPTDSLSDPVTDLGPVDTPADTLADTTTTEPPAPTAADPAESSTTTSTTTTTTTTTVAPDQSTTTPTTTTSPTPPND